MSTFTETRWIGYEPCPNGGTIHVLPVTISSSHRLVALETPGDIVAAEPCSFCCIPPAATEVEPETPQNGLETAPGATQPPRRVSVDPRDAPDPSEER